MRELTPAKIAEVIIADLIRVAPLSGSDMKYDEETGCVDFCGVFRPIEIASHIYGALHG
jgi:hypothetical protein